MTPGLTTFLGELKEKRLRKPKERDKEIQIKVQLLGKNDRMKALLLWTSSSESSSKEAPE